MSGDPKSKQSTLSPQQLAMLSGIGGNAPVAQAQGSMPGQQGLLGQQGGATGQATAGGGMTPQMLAQLAQQYPQLFSGSQ